MMSRVVLVIACGLALAACRDEVADLPMPAAMTEEAVGYYCQMHLLEHEGPKAQAHLDGTPAPLFFSQVRDLVAYMRMPEQSHDLVVAYVSDMGAEGATWADPGAENWIAVTEAYYVVGSAVTGGMGAPELVPFSSPEAAQAFADLHGGSVMGLEDIPDSSVLAPVESDAPGAEEDFLRRLEAVSHRQEDRP